MPPPSQFKPTPASRIFGFGLPVNRAPRNTFMGEPLVGDLKYFNPLVQQQAREERRLALEEQQLALQQRELERHQRAMDAEEAALAGIESGEEIGNVFQKNPALALSRNFNQFANMAEMAKPSKAMQSVIPSLAMKLPIEERGIFNQLINDPQYSANPFAAYDEAQRRSARAKQHGELVKSGVPLAKIDQARDYSPIEFEDLVRQHKKPETGTDFTDNLVKQAWSGFDEQYMPPEGVTDPVAIALDIADKKNSIREGIMRKYGGKPSIQAPATAQNITSPAAMGGTAAIPFRDGLKQAASTPSMGGLPPEAIARLQTVPANELENAIKKEEEAFNASSEINKAWDDARNELEEKIKKVLPDKANKIGINPLELFAQQVLNGTEARGRSAQPQMLMGAGSGVAPNIVPVWQNVLEDAGLNPFGKVFQEPGEKRKKLFGLLGSQDVSYAELIQDWAKRFLENRGKISTPLAEKQNISSEERAKGANVLNKYVPAP